MRVFLVASIVLMSSVVISAYADNRPYGGRGYWPGKQVAGRSYCGVTSLDSMESNGNLGNHFSGIIRETVRFGWNGQYTQSFLSVALTFHLLHPINRVITDVDDTPRPDVTGTYTQSGSRLVTTITDPGADEGFSITWYVSGDGSMIHGAGLRRVHDPEIPERMTGQKWQITLIEGDDCTADVPFDE